MSSIPTRGQHGDKDRNCHSVVVKTLVFPLITLCIVSLALFDFSRVFFFVFPRVYGSNMLVSKTQIKTREKREKNKKCKLNMRKCFYITLCVR